MVVTLPPEHLVLTLKRFRYDLTTGQRTKILTPVRFPLALWLPALKPKDAHQGVSAVSLFLSLYNMPHINKS